MGTPFVATTLYLLTTFNAATGQLTPLPKEEWPVGGGPVFFSELYCLMARGKMAVHRIRLSGFS